jgi:flagellar motor switch/type III secretory pathway protein FliN
VLQPHGEKLAWRAWLPESALRPCVVEPMLASAVEAWSRKWFAGDAMRLLGSLRKGGASLAPPNRAESLHVLDDGLAIAVERRMRIAGAMLDHAIDDKRAGAADRAVLERLVDGCLDDLRQRLCALLKLPPDAVWRQSTPSEGLQGEFWSCAIGATDAEPLARLYLGTTLFVSLIRLSARTAPESVRLRPIGEGLARQAVTVAAFVGGCDLPLADIASLAPGDVVVLDHDVADDLELQIDGDRRLGRCALQPEGERFLLEIKDSILR